MDEPEHALVKLVKRAHAYDFSTCRVFSSVYVANPGADFFGFRTYFFSV